MGERMQDVHFIPVSNYYHSIPTWSQIQEQILNFIFYINLKVRYICIEPATAASCGESSLLAVPSAAKPGGGRGGAGVRFDFDPEFAGRPKLIFWPSEVLATTSQSKIHKKIF